MNIVQITPGSGAQYCGNCFRDNTLVTELRRLGHAALMVPMYLPLKLDEADASRGTPIFFSGINVFLEQQGALFRAMPSWLHRWLASPRLLSWVGRLAAKTKPDQVGALTVSMLEGEHGNQSREIHELVGWLRDQARPDVICLSNLLLMGLARRLRQGVGAPVACLVAGEDAFLDALAEPHRSKAWKILAESTHDADVFIAPSRFYADVVSERLRLPPDRLRVVPTGINPAGFELEREAAPPPAPPAPPALGFFARMCPEKGLDLLVEAFIRLKQRGRVPGVRLKIGGGCEAADRPFVRRLRARLRDAGCEAAAEFHPNLDRAGKVAFLKSLSVFSVPAAYGQAFGLYLVEAMAAGVPVVQPRHASFPEQVEASEAGVLCEPGDPESLALTVEGLLLDPARLRQMAAAGRRAVARDYTARRMAERTLEVFRELAAEPVTTAAVAAG